MSFQFWARANRIIWWGNGEQVSRLCKAEIAAKTSFEIVLEYSRWRASPRGNRPVDCRQRLSKMRGYGVFIPNYGAIEWLSNRRVPQVFVRSESGSLDVNCPADPLQNKVMSTYHVVSHVIMRYTTWPLTWSCMHGSCLNLNIEPIALNHVPTHLEILLFLPLCNSNPSAFFTACRYFSLQQLPG